MLCKNVCKIARFLYIFPFRGHQSSNKLKIAKASGNETINDWIKPCTKHLLWSVTSTQSGNGDVIWAKFTSFFSHVVSKHKNLKNLLFNKCAHDDNIHPRMWLNESILVIISNRSSTHANFL